MIQRHRHRGRGSALSLIGLAIPLCSSCSGGGDPDVERRGSGLSIEADGAFSCDFDLPVTMDPSTIAPIIERDRMYMAARRGMATKLIPFVVDPITGRIRTGGRYLFETAPDAIRYRDWVENEYALDGVPFFQRSYFIDPVCHTWNVVGAEDLGDVRTTQHLLRTERFQAPPTHTRQQLVARWPEVLEDGRTRGLSGVRLVYNREEQLVEILHIARRDVVSIVQLEESPSLGLPLFEDGLTKSFDRTQFVLTIWFPFVAGDRGEAAPYPNSPPLPSPYCDDGVCEVSRGEDHGTCPSDCPPACGDAVCQTEQGEDTHNCPGDCRLS